MCNFYDFLKDLEEYERRQKEAIKAMDGYSYGRYISIMSALDEEQKIVDYGMDYSGD